MPQRPLIASLLAFFDAALRPPSALARAIVVVLAAKLIAVTAMVVYFHFANQHVVADAAAIDRLLSPVSLP
jgi:cell shape-determining protein MreD